MRKSTAVPSALAEILARKRILVCVGSGGVGKTTTAAALALEAARLGRRTLVLTIDPAKRLANSLGLTALGHEVQRVPDELLEAAGERTPGGELWAMMLDQKRAFDEVVARYATDPRAVARIMANPIYAQISGSLAGSQEYAAMAKLDEFDREKRWDMIVVDTPPTSHALDFLDAPEKITQAIDSPLIDWFRRAGEGRSWSLIGRSSSYVFKRLTKFVGSQFLQDVAVFLTEFNDILGGFRQRATETFELLRQDRVGFLLVASPEPMAVEEALFFHQRLIASSMPFAAFVVNKVHGDRPVRAPRFELAERLGRLAPVAALELQPTELEQAVVHMLTGHADIQVLAAADLRAIGRMRAASSPETTIIQVPLMLEDIHDVRGLAALGGYMFAG